MALQFQCMTDPPAQDFLEAVELRHDLFLRTKDPDPNFREVLVKPYFLGHITGAPYGRPEVPLPSLWVNVPGVRTNHAFALCEIVEWAVVTEADLTVRTLREKARHDFSLHPADKMLENMDRDLRQHWRAATQHPDFDPAPFVALDRRLGELAAALRAWHDDLGKAGVPLYSVAALPGKWTGIRRYRRHNTLYGARAALALAEQRAGKGTVQIRALCRWCLHWSPHGQPCTKHITNERTKG